MLRLESTGLEEASPSAAALRSAKQVLRLEVTPCSRALLGGTDLADPAAGERERLECCDRSGPKSTRYPCLQYERGRRGVQGLRGVPQQCATRLNDRRRRTDRCRRCCRCRCCSATVAAVHSTSGVGAAAPISDRPTDRQRVSGAPTNRRHDTTDDLALTCRNGHSPLFVYI